MTIIRLSTTFRQPKALAVAGVLAIGSLIPSPIGLAPARAQSAMDQLKDAAGGNENHEFDGSPHNDDLPPAEAPSVPDPGPGEPVSSD